MKRYQFLGPLLVLALLITGCASESSPGKQSDLAEDPMKSDTSAHLAERSSEQSTDSNTLIAYFTWADNTIVEDEDAALQSALSHYESVGDGVYDEADAVASASIVPPGNAARIAEWIQEETGGDLFSIQVEEPYPSDYDECMDWASDELAKDARPKLKTHIEDLSQYDTVFIGYPNWWYTCPMAIHSFIEEYDLSGKKIVLFCTHGTGGLARSVKDITDSLPDSCEVEENVLGIYRPDVINSQNAVLEWLSEI